MNKIGFTGVVVCGGKSSRMGKDKSMLQYYDKPHRYHIIDLLRPFCENIYISLNNNQDEVTIDKYKIIRDELMFANLGPMTALLSAYNRMPDNNLLFIGCDYPLLTAADLSPFVQSIDATTKAKAFFNEAGNFYEPLLAYYPASFGKELLAHFRQGHNSLQQLLKQINAEKHLPADKKTLRSVDNQEQFEEVIAILRK